VLGGLGADLDRLRSQVLSLHRGRAAEGPPGGPPGRIRPGGDILASLEALDVRLAAIERWVGIRPRLDDLDTEIAKARRDKEAAIGAQDFKAAAALRDREKELVAEKDQREQTWTPGPALVGEIGRLSAELGQLRSTLRGLGTEPADGGAA
jgi:UvrB/uvrC motif